MTTAAALAAFATLVSAAFFLSTLERWRSSRKPHELAWTISMMMFALAALSFFAAAALGWSEENFKGFYLFGAILNVPYLALGTVYLLAGRGVGDRVFPWMNLTAAFCAGVVLASPTTADLAGEAIPSGKEVLGVAPRIMAAIGSGVGATILIVGALWSAASLLRSGRRAGNKPPGRKSSISPLRLALTNLFIAVGSIILAVGGTMFGTGDQMVDFALALSVGVSVLFAGFLISNPTNPTSVNREALDPYWAEISDLIHRPAQESTGAG